MLLSEDSVTTVSQLYQQAQRYLPGGVSATARANAAVGHPLYVSRGDGSRLYDVEGREYVDMCMSHGASLLGHNHPALKSSRREGPGPGHHLLVRDGTSRGPGPARHRVRAVCRTRAFRQFGDRDCDARPASGP